MINLIVHYILCRYLWPNYMCAYIFGKEVVTTAFCIFIVVITTAPHLRLMVHYVFFDELIIITGC